VCDRACHCRQTTHNYDASATSRASSQHHEARCTPRFLRASTKSRAGLKTAQASISPQLVLGFPRQDPCLLKRLSRRTKRDRPRTRRPIMSRTHHYLNASKGAGTTIPNQGGELDTRARSTTCSTSNGKIRADGMNGTTKCTYAGEEARGIQISPGITTSDPPTVRRTGVRKVAESRLTRWPRTNRTVTHQATHRARSDRSASCRPRSRF